jgi:cellulose biosynthesis protein BcsQ
MYAEQGRAVLAADLDPQANLSAGFLDEDRLEELWPDGEHPNTVYGCIHPLLAGTGDVADSPHVEEIDAKLHIVVGDLALARFEDELSQQWPACLDRKERAFRVISAFWRLMQRGASSCGAEFVLLDLGPNLGAINRAALIAADHLVVPLAPDLFSLQGLKNLGPTVRRWREEWEERRKRNPVSDLPLPEGRIEPMGYVVMQHATRLDRPVKAYERWVSRIPADYAAAVLDEAPTAGQTEKDPHCLGLIKHYRSLMPMAQESRKPMFKLTSADGAVGSHARLVQDAGRSFRSLADRIAVHFSPPPTLRKPLRRGTSGAVPPRRS